MTAAPLPDLSSPPRTGVRPLDLLLVAILTAAAFMPNLYGRISPLDDYLMLVSTQQFKTPTWAGYANFWFVPPFKIFMPLTLTVWQAIAHFSYHPESEPMPWAMNMVGFKAASIIVHALSAAAATWSLSVFTRSRWPAIVGGLLFALHPVQVESVCWTTGLKDELCGLFAILTLGLYREYLSNPPAAAWKSGFWIAAVITALLAMLSKPTGMMLAVSLTVLEFSFRKAPLARRLPALWVFFVFAVICGRIAQGLQPPANVGLPPVWSRPLTALDSIAFYLFKIVIPVNLVQDYGRYPEMIISSGQIYWTWILPAAIAIAMLAFCRARLVWVAAALFVIPIAPVSGLIPFDMQQFSTTADHYLYQPMFGVGLLVAFVLTRWRSWIDLVAVLVLCVLGTLSWCGAKAWQRPAVLFENMLKANPHSWMARAVLTGFALEYGDMSYAPIQIALMRKERPTTGDAEKFSALLYTSQARYREAAEMAEKALAIKPDNVILARRLLKLGALLHDPDIATKGVTAWLKLEPGNQAALQILTNVRRAAAAEKLHPTTAPATLPEP